VFKLTISAREYSYRTEEGTVTITGYSGAFKNLVIPSTIGGLPVTSISDCAFAKNTNITDVTIPDSVESIGDGAFYYCSNLSNVTFGTNVKTIGNYAFEGCALSNNFVIPDSVADIGKWAFKAVKNLSVLTIPCNVKNIGFGIVKNSSVSQINVDYRNTSYSSENGILYNKDKTLVIECPTKKSGVVTINNNTLRVGDGAFDGCSLLTAIVFSGNLEEIGAGAIFDCISLSELTIPSSVTRIEKYAVAFCYSLKNVYLLGNTVNIEWGAFSNCNSSTTINAYPGSSANSFAQTNKINFASINSNAKIISFGIYRVFTDNMIKNISDRTTISSYIGQLLTSANVTVEIIDYSNKILNNTTEDSNKYLIGTGSKLRIRNKGVITEEYTNIVNGDLDYNGTVDIIDLSLIKKHLLKVSQLSDIAKKAADMNGNEFVSISDLIMMNKHILGLY
jgi:hypothetical protein